MLGGLAAIAAPILIHLLLRRKSQRMKFSTVQFFAKQDEQSIRRRKLRNLFLLATRVLLFALIALAFARPLFPGGAEVVAAERRQLVILLDTSASMQAEGPDGAQWTRALAAAQKELGELKMDDRAALVTCSTRAEIINEFAPAAVILKRLQEIQPSYGSARLDEGLRQVSKVLATANPAHKIDVCIVSDLQRSGCETIGNTSLPNDVAVRMVDLGERFIPNIAVNGLQLEATDESGPHATVTSFSDETIRAGYRVMVDGQEVFTGAATVNPGGTTNIPLAIPVLAPGWHSAQFELEGKDALKADDIAYATIFVPRPIHGLVVEPRRVAQVFLEESYFVATALNPTRTESQPSLSGFTYEKTTHERLRFELKPEPGQSAIQYILLPGVKNLPTDAITPLHEFVRGGGGLILFLGPGTSPLALARLGDLLPAQIGKVESLRELEPGWHLGRFDPTAPMFADFREPASGNLSLPEFTQRFSIKPGPGSSVVANFEDGMPLIVARAVGEGRVVVVNTSADTAWTDWQKHKSFVPWLHATAGYVASSDQTHQRETMPAFVSGTELPLAANEALELKKQTLKLQRVGGKEVSFLTDDDRVAQELLLERPGIYILRDGTGRELRRLAANLPSGESELSALPPIEVEQQVVRSAETTPQILAAGLFGDPSLGRELWRVLLICALALLLLEPVLANRMFA